MQMSLFPAAHPSPVQPAAPAPRLPTVAELRDVVIEAIAEAVIEAAIEAGRDAAADEDAVIALRDALRDDRRRRRRPADPRGLVVPFPTPTRR